MVKLDSSSSLEKKQSERKALVGRGFDKESVVQSHGHQKNLSLVIYQLSFSFRPRARVPVQDHDAGSHL
jgi:hypothetical protein